MFRGVNAVNLDTKGRMTLPMRYRELMSDISEGRLVVTIDTEERCLLIYPLPDWNTLQSKIEALPSFNPAARRIQRLLIGHATDVELDGNGRLLIPPPLRAYAYLEKKVVLLGQGRKIEVWSESHWEERRDSYLEMSGDSSQIPEELMTLSL